MPSKYSKESAKRISDRAVDISFPLELLGKIGQMHFDKVEDYIYKLENMVAEQSQKIIKLEKQVEDLIEGKE